MAKRTKKSVLTEQQEALVEGVLDGKSPSQAAVEAGYSHPSAASTVMRSETVKLALAERRHELSSATQITRAGVLEGILEAIDMARMMADPTAMLTGYRDISKMMGYNAPEVKKIEISDTSDRLHRRMQALSDEDLLKIINGEADMDVIEGEARRVD